MITPPPSPHSRLAGAAADWISSGFGSGYARVAPGTVGSAAALLFWLMLSWFGLLHSPRDTLILAVGTTVVGTLAVRASLRGRREDDPGWIVIDEWAGLFLALAGTSGADLLMAGMAFGVFRLFDVAKPGPVAWAERLPGALGVMADDIIAGALACLVVQAAWILARAALA